MNRISWIRASILALCGLLACGRAEACGYVGPPHAMIHTALPRILPRGAVVAEVRFESADVLALVGPGIRARIRKMIQGDYRGRFLIVRPARLLGCGVAFANGRSGYIVAVPRGFEEGILVVHPIQVQRGRSLPNGCRVPPWLTAAVALPGPARDARPAEDRFEPDICEGRKSR